MSVISFLSFNYALRMICDLRLQRIKLCLTRGSVSSTWVVDDKPSNAKAVLGIVARSGAQLADLCTFLPQEKVYSGPFIKMLPPH